MSLTILLSLLRALAPGDALVYSYSGETCETTVNFAYTAHPRGPVESRLKSGRTHDVKRVPGVDCETAWFVVTRDARVHAVESCTENTNSGTMEITYR